MIPVSEITIGYKNLVLKEFWLLPEWIVEMGERRYEICVECPDAMFDGQAKKCLYCHCKMLAKTTVPQSYCPAGYWHKEIKP